LIKRREISILICAILGIVMIAQYYIVDPTISFAAQIFQVFTTSIASFMMIFGTTTLVLFHINHVRKRTPGQWYVSVWTVFLIISLSIIGLVFGSDHIYFKWMFENVFINLDTAMYSILGFYVIAAAWRAFRARNIDATFLLIAGVLTALVNAPVAELVFGKTILDLGNWVMNVPTMAGIRTTYFGIALGSIYLALRTFIGRERGWLGVVKEEK
jgi:hypothetical protein